MAAAALEQSVLESKDKDTLLEMAKALGVKATARMKKSEIIDKILDTTSAVARSDESSAAPAAPSVPSNGAEPSAPAADESAAPAAPSGDGDGDGDRPARLGPDGEPLADWEIELADRGADAPDGAEAAPARRGDGDGAAPAARSAERSDGGRPADGRQGGDNRQQRSRDGRQGGEGRQGGQGGGQGDNRQGGQGGEGRQGVQQGGGQGGQQGGGQGDNRQGGQQGGGESRQGGQQGGGQQGDGQRRRRRRRNKRGGQDGPQGEDAELLLDDDGQPQSNEPVEVAGYLDMRDEGYGFLRVNGYLPSKQDAYIPVKLARQFGLRKGDHVTGKMRPPGRNEKNPALLEIYTVNDGDAETAKKRPRFEDLTALFPDQRLTLEDPSDPGNMTARIIDLISPIGKGQRGILVSPPKAGKTTVMKTIAKSIETNNPEVKLIVLLIDERPEEVTDIRRTVKGEVISSTFDRPSDEHTHIAEMAIAKAKRMVESGADVVIMLDGITRLSRAYNLAAPASGRILSGGIDAGALYPPKKFFGAARNVEEGGSLTILATALVDTNSRMDEAIFEEFKGTGNMELRLDRKISERRIYPAIDVDASSTRHEELLFDRKELQMVWKLRRVLSGLAADGNAAPGLELLIDRLKTFRTNSEFLNEIAKQPGM